MIIDNGPSIQKWAEARLKQLESESAMAEDELTGRRDELHMVVTLCQGLEKQTELLTKALGL